MKTKLLAAISASILIFLAVVTPDRGAAATVAATVPQGVTLQGPNVIDYENLRYNGEYLYLRPTFVKSERLIRQGTPRADGGCTFVRSVRVTATDPGPLTELELAYDPATCRSLVEIGQLAAAQQLTLGTGALERGSRSFGTTSSSGATGGR